MNKVTAFLASKYKPIILAAFIAAFLGLFSLLAIKGSYSRYAQDDYCYGYRFRVDNFWKAQVKSYFGYTEYNANRYSLTLFNGLAEQMGGPSFAPFMPALLLTSWVAILIYILYLLLRKPGQPLLWIIAAPAIVLFTFLASPNLYQILFWVSATNTYTTPTIITTLILARILHFTLRGKFTKWNMAEVIFLNILAGAFSETLTAWLLALWCCMFVVLLTLSPNGLFQKAKWPLILAVAGTLVAIVLMVINPTNAHRVSFYRPENVLLRFFQSFSTGLLFIKRSLKFTPLPFGFVLLLGVWLGAQTTSSAIGTWKKGLLAIAATLATGFLLCSAVMAPSVVLTNSYPSDRMLLSATFSLILALCAAGWIAANLVTSWLSKLIPQKVVTASLIALGVVMLAYLGTTFPQVYDKMPLYKARAVAWDARQQMILESKAAGQRDITVPAFDSIFGITELGSDSHNWVNTCAAWYYRVDSITAKDGYQGFSAFPIGR